MSDQDARTEADRRYPKEALMDDNGLIYPVGALIGASRGGFIAGAEWQRSVDRSYVETHMQEVIERAKHDAWDECAHSLHYSDGSPVEVVAILNPYKKES